MRKRLAKFTGFCYDVCWFALARTKAKVVTTTNRIKMIRHCCCSQDQHARDQAQDQGPRFRDQDQGLLVSRPRPVMLGELKLLKGAKVAPHIL